MMTEKFKILANYIKDMSSETPDIETFLFVKENISRYQLNISINSKALKNLLKGKPIEVGKEQCHSMLMNVRPVEDSQMDTIMDFSRF